MPRKKIHYLFKSPLKRLIINSIDNLGYLFFPASNIKQKAFDDLKNILIIRLDHIGDFILTLPAIYHLKDMKPDIEISILCDSSLRTVAQATNLFKNVHISSNHWFKRSGNFLLKIKAFFALRNELLKFKYDAGVDFRGDFRNILLLSMSQIKIRLAYPNTGGGFLLQNTNQIIEDQHQIKTNLDLLGLFSIPKAESIVLPTIKPNSKCPETISQLGEQIIAIHPGAGELDKIWPEDRYEKLIVELHQKYQDFKIVLLGTLGEKRSSKLEASSRLNIIDLRGDTKIEDLFHLFERATLFIGNDSGIGHIASTFKIPVITIFSLVNNPDRWKPWTDRLYLITGEVQDISVKRIMQSVHEALDQC